MSIQTPPLNLLFSPHLPFFNFYFVIFVFPSLDTPKNCSGMGPFPIPFPELVNIFFLKNSFSFLYNPYKTSYFTKQNTSHQGTGLHYTNLPPLSLQKEESGGEKEAKIKMASKTLLCVLLCALIVPSVEGIDNKVVCACRCCYSGFDCHPFTNGTFQIDSCSECTSGKCEARAATATTLGCTGESRYVISECYNRDAFFPKVCHKKSLSTSLFFPLIFCSGFGQCRVHCLGRLSTKYSGDCTTVATQPRQLHSKNFSTKDK